MVHQVIIRNFVKGGKMSEELLFQSMYKLTERVKGAPLRVDEIQSMIEKYNKSSGSPYDRAISAMTDVLHCEPSLLYKKREAQEDIDQMLKKVKAKAEAVS
jgi:hypothetical protein